MSKQKIDRLCTNPNLMQGTFPIYDERVHVGAVAKQIERITKYDH